MKRSCNQETRVSSSGSCIIVTFSFLIVKKKRTTRDNQSVNTLKYILNPTPSSFCRFAFRSFEKQSRSNTNRVHAPEYDTRILFTVQYFNHAYRTRKTHTFTSTFTLSRHLRACGRACPSIPICLHIYLTKRPKAWINSLKRRETKDIFKTFHSLSREFLLSPGNHEKNETRMCIYYTSVLLVDSIEKIKKGNSFLFLVNNNLIEGKFFNSLSS